MAAKKKEKPLTPQQIDFLKYYLDPKSLTYSNALQSALKAGYSQEYSEKITYVLPDWLSEKVGSDDMLEKAERNIIEILEMPTRIGDTGYHMEKLIKVKGDMSKFVAETIGKKKYSKKIEFEGFNFNKDDLKEFDA